MLKHITSHPSASTANHRSIKTKSSHNGPSTVPARQPLRISRVLSQCLQEHIRGWNVTISHGHAERSHGISLFPLMLCLTGASVVIQFLMSHLVLLGVLLYQDSDLGLTRSQEMCYAHVYKFFVHGLATQVFRIHPWAAPCTSLLDIAPPMS